MKVRAYYICNLSEDFCLALTDETPAEFVRTLSQAQAEALGFDVEFVSEGEASIEILTKDISNDQLTRIENELPQMARAFERLAKSIALDIDLTNAWKAEVAEGWVHADISDDCEGVEKILTFVIGPKSEPIVI